ncbi:unnamed protein product [Durusdinium trenchii]|uniref:Uncharacterized protein n=1 Tax=Durusdinium trenchii TaxID=1381693 RepID=A0ABP0QX46_9DINO
MTGLHHLSELPEFDGREDNTLRHMRVQELVGETEYVWAIQDDENVSTRAPLPAWMARIIEMRVCKFVTDHDSWNTTIQKREAAGQSLTKSQKARYDAWKASCCERLVFNKRRQTLVQEVKQVNRDCIAIELNLSEDPCELQVAASSGKWYRLVLLDCQASSEKSAAVPEMLDQAVDKESLQMDNDAAASGAEEEGNERELTEAAIQEQAAQRHALEGGENLDQPDDWLVLADSDEDIEQFGVPGAVSKVKSFNLRPAWCTLEKQGLTDLPRHVVGCSISCHSTSQQWQAFYPGCKSGMSCSWGKTSHRSECEAILRCVRAVLEGHVRANPKDSVWKRQLDKVLKAEASKSF